MQQPTTPSKAKRAEEIEKADKVTRIIKELSSNWGLQFPVRDVTWSPSKIPKQKPASEDAFGRIKFLCSYRNKPALDYALKHFDEVATRICSQWVPKPYAERDVTPRRINTRGSSRGDAIHKRSNTDQQTANELMEELLAIVSQITNCVKAGADYRIFDEDTVSDGTLAEPKKSHTSKQAKLTQYYNLRENQMSPFKTPGKNVPTSSDEFNPDQDTYSILEDITMIDGPPMITDASLPKIESGALRPRESDDEDYQTPPTTPPSEPLRRQFVSDQTESKSQAVSKKMESCFQRPDPVALSSPIRKRPYEESLISLESRKISRGKERTPSQVIYNVKHLSPTEAAVETGFPGYQKPSVRTIDNINKMPIFSCPPTSFDSTMSGSSSKATFSFPAPSTAWTTPNTSFRTEPLVTSFDSVSDSADVTEDLILSRKSKNCSLSNSITKAVPESPRTERMNAGLRRLTTNPDIRKNSMAAEPMDIDGDKPINICKPVDQLGSCTIRGIKVGEYLEKYLLSPPWIATATEIPQSNIPFRQLYEVTRVSLHCKLSMEVFSNFLNQNNDDYEKLWSSLGSIAKAHNASLPEKSSSLAWGKAIDKYDGTSLTGSLKYSSKAETPIFEFSLNPLRSERSYRLSRQFGGDRFFVIEMPGISTESFPTYLKSYAMALREYIIGWLVNTEHRFLGRTWRAFYVKPEPRKNRGSAKGSIDSKFRVYFFASENNNDFDGFVKWFLPFKYNLDQPCLKFFARLGLGVSNTYPTIKFNPSEIVRTHDARAGSAHVRLLQQDRADVPMACSDSKVSVMNDGCARISKAAATKIAQLIGISPTPCVFQGRIGGAKGLWMVDTLGETVSGRERDLWIEITDSQLKFEPYRLDSYNPPDNRITFEVVSYSASLHPAALNFQLLPILVHGGVPLSTFECLLKDDLMSKVGALNDVLESGLKIRKWIQDTNPVAWERAQSNGIPMLGGLPNSRPEKIIWFVEHGFEPKNCRHLKNILYDEISEYCMRLEDKMNIVLGKSTYAFMMADPLGVLEENQIHLGFLQPFFDPKDNSQQLELHNIEVLVARSPASLPSDIQKVNTVFKSELLEYRNAVVFSSKGKCSLAEKLSGGDYDGDKAWICWEPKIVEPFNNSPVPEHRSLESFGIKKDSLKVSDIYSDQDYIRKFLRHGFEFNMQSAVLGMCTTYHEALCYHEKNISDPKAINLALLLGHLVDRPKAGMIFDEDSWKAYKRDNDLKGSLPKPAYKDKNGQPKLDHPIDKLVFKTAKGVRTEVLSDFDKKFKHVASWDEDLGRPWSSQLDWAKSDEHLAQALTHIKAELREISDFWVKHVPPQDRNSDWPLPKKPTPNSMSFSALVQRCRSDFLALQPRIPPNTPKSSILYHWERENSSSSSFSSATNTSSSSSEVPTSWNQLKASGFFHLYHERNSIVWFVAGAELGQIKARSRSYRIVEEGIYQTLKVGKSLEGPGKRNVEATVRAEEDDEDDEYGSWGWDD